MLSGRNKWLLYGGRICRRGMLKCMLLPCCFAIGSIEIKMAGNELCKLYISSYTNSTQAKKLRRAQFLE